MSVAGILLTGGKARRLGTDKAALRLGGVPLGERGERLLGEVADVVVAVTRADAADGPLSAVAAGWGRARLRPGGADLAGAVILAVDMPLVPPAMVRWLAGRRSTTVPVAGGHPQPLCAFYSAAALDRAAGVLAAGERSMAALLAAVPHRRVHPHEWAAHAVEADFRDIDTPADLDAVAGRFDSRHGPSCGHG